MPQKPLPPDSLSNGGRPVKRRKALKNEAEFRFQTATTPVKLSELRFNRRDSSGSTVATTIIETWRPPLEHESSGHGLSTADAASQPSPQTPPRYRRSPPASSRPASRSGGTRHRRACEAPHAHRSPFRTGTPRPSPEMLPQCHKSRGHIERFDAPSSDGRLSRIKQNSCFKQQRLRFNRRHLVQP